MRLYLIRHGESEANTLEIISNRDMPHPLTEAGRRQAMALAEKLTGASINHIFTSPILRACETAEIIASILLVPAECTSALREPDCGILEGRADEAAWEEHNYWKKKWLEGCEHDRGPEGGETYNEICERFSEFVKSLVAQYGNTEAGLLLVKHGALLLFGLPALCPNSEMKSVLERGVGYCASLVIELQNGKFTCRDWEDSIRSSK
jgi:broad specificity phosphatase PhoE